MKTVIPISEARKKLPSLVKSFKNSPDTVYQITVHDEVVAEIKRPSMVKPGEAAAKMLKLRGKMGVKRKRYRTPVSENIKEHLYVAEDSN